MSQLSLQLCLPLFMLRSLHPIEVVDIITKKYSNTGSGLKPGPARWPYMRPGQA